MNTAKTITTSGNSIELGMLQKAHSTVNEISKIPGEAKPIKKNILKQLFEEELKEIHSAEKLLLESYLEINLEIHSDELREIIIEHMEQAKKHADQLQKILIQLQISKMGEVCKAIETLIDKGKKISVEYDNGCVRDSALIINFQKIEHYKIAAYGSLCELADVLGYHQISDTLDYILEEEESADYLLAEFAKDTHDEACEN
jgi:ferritin-like metal-binding protein YciE